MTLSGIVILVKLLQPENTEWPILVTLLGIVTPVKLLQPSNAEEPILVTLLPIVTLVKLLQSLNASEPILSLPVIITFLSEGYGIRVDTIYYKQPIYQTYRTKNINIARYLQRIRNISIGIF